MGVHGLWELLAPVGRRVSVETVSGKKLAIDASIWMIQFMKAMRDDKGEMVRNAHLLGFFRRICKLLFLRTKPVFVFDGGTPALKRRTVIARRRQRENAQAKIRKTAEKLLLNHLKAMRLKEVSKDLESQRQKHDSKGKNVMTNQMEMEGDNMGGNNIAPFSCNQEALDEMLAASLAAEEDGDFIVNASTSGEGIHIEEKEVDEDEDDDEEMVLPAMNGKVDPAVLAALPPSMQLDLLVQMREKLMAENRQKYQKVKKVPSKFSELQIEAYLKTVAFRREIDEVQKSASGKAVGGVQTSRVASEANREFIFSSSFTGDKQVLASAGVERNSEKLHQTPFEPPPLASLDSIASTKSIDEDPGRVLDDIKTYLDERGCLRVSRMRAMGIRMTRDLQRNLDLMKESEQEGVQGKHDTDNECVPNNHAVSVSGTLPEIQHKGTSVQLDNSNGQSISKIANPIEISFEDDGGHEHLDGDDPVFAHLVAGDPVMVSSADDSPLKEHSCDPDSDCDWEAGVIEERGGTSTHHIKEKTLSLPEGDSPGESEVEWENGDGEPDLKFAFSSYSEARKTASKGVLEEEADFQEAIRRSLEDFSGKKSDAASSEDEKLKEPGELAGETTGLGSVSHENNKAGYKIHPENVMHTDKSCYEVDTKVQHLDSETKLDILNTDDSARELLSPSVVVKPDSLEGPLDKAGKRVLVSEAGPFPRDASECENLLGEIRHDESTIPVEEKGGHLTVEQPISNKSNAPDQVPDTLLGETPHIICSDVQQNAAADCHAIERSEQGESSVKESCNNGSIQNLPAEKNHADFAMKKGEDMEEFTSQDDKEQPIEVTNASLEEEMLKLSKERRDLGDEQRKLERNAESVSSEMFAECQELLQMFGLPYIIAPMEAEAQCAYLELANLVDGVVTDDSDVFLFGARSIYKNMFDDRKYVETYLMKDIENELGLTREKLIRMALLLGSDYTEGVSGIGIVNAIEVVNAFPEEDGLRKFREWIESPDPTILGKFDVQTRSTLNKGASTVSNDMTCSDGNKDGLTANDRIVPQSMDYNHKMKQIFMDKHRNVSKNWDIPSSFPNNAVIFEYASPQVDKSTEPFSWGKPDPFLLRKLCWEKFGWSTQKADELILPVLKEYNKHETQLRLEAFYTFNERFAKIRSKRIKKAVSGIAGNISIELTDDVVEDVSKTTKKRRVSPREHVEDKSEKPFSGQEDCVSKGQSNPQRSTMKRSRRRKHEELVPSEETATHMRMQAEGVQNTRQGMSARGQRRGRETGQALGSSRRKKNPGHSYHESISNDGSDSDYEQEVQVEKLEGTQGVRKSTRARKAVKYTLEVEIDEAGKGDEDEDNCTGEEAVQQELSEDHDLTRDAEAGPSETDQDKVDDPSCLDHSSWDYLQTGGGGFCIDGAEIELERGQPSAGQNGDPLVEAELSKAYLKMGGGFCADEDGGTEDPDELPSRPPTACTSDDTNPAHFDNHVVEADLDTSPVQLVSSATRASDEFQDRLRTEAFDDGKQDSDHLAHMTSDDNSSLARSPQESIRADDSSTAPANNSLRAMPYLRRKRRKG
ncbi:DNA repair protein UVH3 isoform X2 [Diospyros lotus]|uniref:DNA repair protein UVH3 isoform X2 n=1 Tax=Diospyros lotus TaxID=55363 RepID=UPI002250D368|nr:DNA repair protein UVH3 isoform X2 [Diospyros lotus]